MNIEELKYWKETEHKVEFKEAKGGNYSYNGGAKADYKDRRKCILGYVVAFANEGGGYLIFGMSDSYPHQVVGTTQSENTIGELEQNIYRDLKIRVEIKELYESNNRVLVIVIPSRPIGKVYKFEDVALMRVGEELLPMSEEVYLKILNEQEPDFSEQICEGLELHDLDLTAIQKMKEAYALKQQNIQFLTLSPAQALSDLNLRKQGKLTNAALVLLGTKDSIQRFLPQSSICIEYRNTTAQITFDNRLVLQEAFYTAIDKVWDTINLRNGKVPVQKGPYIFDIPYFNEEVIREAINNAISHRDYRKNSEVLIKQYPTELHIVNPGGFPPGVSLKNLLTVNSTPRNRLLSDVLAKTGIVERSGQGIDKIFYQCLSEAKPEPDYQRSDDFQVELRLSALVEDKAFALFIRQIQDNRKDDEKLSLEDIITLNNIRKGTDRKSLDEPVLKKLEKYGLVERLGKTNAQKIVLSKEYYVSTDRKGDYPLSKELDSSNITLIIFKHLKEFGTAQMGEFVNLFSGILTRDQIRHHVEKLVESEILERKGKGRSTEYRPGKRMSAEEKLINRIIELGFQEMKKLGEIEEPMFQFVKDNK